MSSTMDSRFVRGMAIALMCTACTSVEIAGGARRLAVPGNAPASFVGLREWAAPGVDCDPRDPAEGADGAFWFTEHDCNRLARLDPTTGAFREFELPTADSGPRGLVIDGRGHLWFGAERRAYIGELDPETGSTDEYSVPVADPRALAFTPDGVLWFTAQDANLIGWFDPTTRIARVRELPTPDGKPTSVVIGPDGRPYFSEFGTNKIGAIAPDTLALEEYVLPAGARPRRIALAPDGTIYYADYARGKIGRLDVSNGRQWEWDSPGGARSRPYGIAVGPDAAVWYSESGGDPNTLVRFDPSQETFRVAPIASGAAVVTNIVATRDGRLFLACSGTNRVAIATPARPR